MTTNKKTADTASKKTKTATRPVVAPKAGSLQPPLSKGEVRLTFIAADDSLAKDLLRFFDEGDAQGHWLVLEPPKPLGSTVEGHPQYEVRLRPEELNLQAHDDDEDDDEEDDEEEAEPSSTYDDDEDDADDDEDDY